MGKGKIPLYRFFMIASALGLVIAAACQVKPDHNGDALDARFLAHDAKTGEYIGVVVVECRNWDTKKVASYKIRLKDGRMIERPPDTITIDQQ